jgi:hypothetical protein
VFAISAAGCAGKLTDPKITTGHSFVSLLRVCRMSAPRDRLLTGCVNGHYDLALEQFSLLITHDQRNGLVPKNDDHVYELTGTRLRQVAEHSWGSDFIAVPW